MRNLLQLIILPTHLRLNSQELSDDPVFERTDAIFSVQLDLLDDSFNPSNAELNPICYLLALLDHHFLHVSRIRVKSLTLRLLMSYIYMERLFLMFLDYTQRRSTVGRTPLDE